MLNRSQIKSGTTLFSIMKGARLRVKARNDGMLDQNLARNDKGNEIPEQVRNDVRMVCGVGRVPRRRLYFREISPAADLRASVASGRETPNVAATNSGVMGV